MIPTFLGGNITPRADGFLAAHDAEKLEPWDPTDKEREIQSYMARFARGHDKDTWKMNFEREWFEAIAMNEGQQYCFWSHSARVLRTIEANPWQRQIVVNKILPGVERAASMLGEMAPEPSVAPAGPELEYRYNAEVGCKLWRAFMQERDTKKKLKLARKWMVVTGNVVAKMCWNPRAGKTVAEYKGEKLQEGQILFELCSIFGIYTDPSVTSLREASWIREESLRSIEYVRARWPERGALVAPQPNHPSLRAWQERNLLTMSARYGSSGTLGGLKQHDRTVLLGEFFMRPNKDYPKGLHVVEANGVFLNPEGGYENEYVGFSDDGFLEIPYFHGVYYDGLNKLWGTGWVANQIPIQREINNRTNIIAEHIQLTTHAPWILAEGCNVEDEMLMPRPDARIYYNPAVGQPPFRAEIPPLPPHVVQSKEDLKLDFDEAGAQSDAMKGQAPGSVRTGIGVQSLQARDAAVVNNPKENYFRWLEEIGKAYLLIHQKKVTLERTAKLLGPSGDWEVFQWKGADLEGATELHYFVDASLGSNAMERRAILQEWITMGILQPQLNPEDREMVMGLMQSKAMDKALYFKTLSKRQAERHILQMTRFSPDGSPPQPIPIEPYWDHLTHYRVKNEFRLTPEFDRLHPYIREMYNSHCNQLAQFVALNKVQENLLGQGMRGGPSDKGTPSPPKGQPSAPQRQAANQAGGMASN